MKSLGYIRSVRAFKYCMVIETRRVNGYHAIHNIPHPEWLQLLDSIGATTDDEAIGHELIERLELMDKTDQPKGAE
jgi:hypothetical protein